MSWAEKAYYFKGQWIKGIVRVPAVDETLLADRNLEEAKLAARPVFELDRDSAVQCPGIQPTADAIGRLRAELWEIEYRLDDLTREQNQAVVKLYKETGERNDAADS